MKWLPSPVRRLVGSDIVRLGTGSFAANSLGVVLALALQLVLANLMKVEQYGVYAYVMAWVSALAMLAKMGLDSATLRLLPFYLSKNEAPLARGFLRFSSRYVFIASVALGLLGGTAVMLMTGHAGARAAFICGLAGLPVLVASEMAGSRLQAMKRAATYLLTQGTVRPLVVLGISIAAVSAGASLTATGVVAANIVAAACVLAMLLRLWGGIQPESITLSQPEARPSQWWRVALPMFAISASQFALARADVLVVGAIASAAEVGVYAVVNQLATIVTLAITAMNLVMAPTISELHARGDRNGLQRALRDSGRIVLVYSLAVCAGLVILGRFVLQAFGPEFATGYEALCILMIGQFVIAYCGPVGFLLTMTEHQSVASLVIVITAVAQIGVCILLTRSYGMVGAATAAAAAQATRSVILSFVVARRLGVSPRPVG